MIRSVLRRLAPPERAQASHESEPDLTIVFTAISAGGESPDHSGDVAAK
jgi:hypothetical protein